MVFYCYNNYNALVVVFLSTMQVYTLVYTNAFMLPLNGQNTTQKKAVT